jgi:hypothetical protein
MGDLLWDFLGIAGETHLYEESVERGPRHDSTAMKIAQIGFEPR